MKKFISAVVSFGLLSALVGCNPDSDHQKKSRNNMAQREQSEISEDVSKLLSDLVVLESQNPQKSSGIMKNCEKFADNLLCFSKKVMARGMNPKINF